MDAITLSVQIPKDRHLVLDLPADTPIGEAEVIIKPHSQTPEVSTEAPRDVSHTNPAREAARAKLLAAGKLVEGDHAPEGTVALTPEERMRTGTLPPGARPSEELIDEDRGLY